MALWRRKSKTERVIEFNQKKLKTEIQNLSSRLYAFKDDLALAVIEEVIQLAHNIQLLEVNRHATGEQLAVHRGRLQALNDLSDYIARSKEAKPDKTPEKPKSRDAINIRRNTEHQAGIAI